MSNLRNTKVDPYSVLIRILTTENENIHAHSVGLMVNFLGLVWTPWEYPYIRGRRFAADQVICAFALAYRLEITVGCQVRPQISKMVFKPNT